MHPRLSALTPQSFHAARPKVLVIDDVPMNASLIASVLEAVGDVHTAHNGEQGLAMAQHILPDVILLDIWMPDLDGFEVLHRLQQLHSTAAIPVIFLTGVCDGPTEERGLNMGAADFIAKPFRAATLLARVRNQLKLVAQRQALEHLSHSDGLTGIANRRYFNQMLEREFHRMQRHQQALALLMVDVDDFKAFNDHYGHVLGDTCLQQVAHTMAHSLQRPGDLVARYGGEEFVCLLPETSAHGALQLAHEIQRRITDLRLPHVQSQAAAVVTVSMGVAAAFAHDMDNSQQLLITADKRLYRAKRAGRNRIVSSD